MIEYYEAWQSKTVDDKQFEEFMQEMKKQGKC